jgi:hypothetical protein
MAANRFTFGGTAAICGLIQKPKIRLARTKHCDRFPDA